MKKLIFIIFLIFSTFSFGQVASLDGDTVTMRGTAPVWPGCQGTESEKETCFDHKLTLHISNNFDFSNGYTSEDKGTQVLVIFVINEQGMPEIKNISGGSKALQAEAKRVILLIPKMKPGMLVGRPTETEYTVPFNF